MRQQPLINLPSISVINTIPKTLALDPFSHKHITDFLKKDFYDDLCALFNEILDRKIVASTEPFDPNRFQRFSYGYDAAYWQAPRDFGYPINEFYSLKWIDFFSKIFGVTLTKDISITFHHQNYDSKPFAAHNDYCIVGMSNRSPDDNTVRQYYFETPYFLKNAEEAKKLNLSAQMRSVVGIFYLNNPEWKEGNGGETALYDCYESYTLNKPHEQIPPISNSMLTFETTPGSFHTYLPNKAKVRNTLLFWLHSDLEEKIKRFHGALPTEYSYTREKK